MPSKKTLVIVESPTKAKTIQKFLGPSYTVMASFGHIRDLPKGKMGIDIEHHFEPSYVIPRAQQKKVTELKKLAQRSSSVILATDEDREGEAIAWHLVQALSLDNNAKRIVFHEITKQAIDEALAHPRDINGYLVNAQQARRVLDRLVGYELSPFLWHKVIRGLSAGRVQSVALRLIAEREREILAFKSQEYWTIQGVFSTATSPSTPAEAQLVHWQGKTLEKFDIATNDQAQDIVEHLKTMSYHVDAIERKQQEKNPLPPFTTSTMQIEANRRCGYSAQLTMRIAQQLYEGVDLGEEGHTGLITYMRTDAVNLSQQFLQEAQSFIIETFGKRYTNGIRTYKAKSKLAQEAHEAIRPTSVQRSPEQLQRFLSPQQLKLYTLIWQRAVSSQMANATVDTTTVDILSEGSPTNQARFRAHGSIITFDGWYRIWPVDAKTVILPTLSAQEKLVLENILPTQHMTQPPARYSDASLVKALEQEGIGRPSTYAPTIATLVARHYTDRIENQRLQPTEIGLKVNDLLVEHFPTIVDYHFTANMEDELDRVAEGATDWHDIIENFYGPFKELLTKKEGEVSKKELTEQATNEMCEKCGKPMVIKLGRFGTFLACTGFPECKHTKPLAGSGESREPIDHPCPQCGKALEYKRGRFGAFIGCSGYPECKYIEKKQQSTGVHCPTCSKGEIVVKRSKRGKTFYACNNYPECKTVFWGRPLVNDQTKQPILCPKCQSYVVASSKTKAACSNKECDYTTPLEEESNQTMS